MTSALVLLDDAVRLARQAATADVEVTLDITPGVPHVFQAYYPILDEAAAALDRAGQLLSAHLAGAERVTAERKEETLRGNGNQGPFGRKEILKQRTAGDRRS